MIAHAAPLVSVCIPAYNAGKYIEVALRSVEAQTFPDWELVVVEDGSSVPVEEQVGRFAARVAQPVRYVRHAVNRGLAAARNTAAKAASGLYMAMLDADDYWAEGHLAAVIGAMGKTNAEIGFSGSWLFDDESGKITDVRKPPADALENISLGIYLHTVTIQPSSAVIDREAFLRIGGSNELFQHCEDIELWLRAARKGLDFAYSGSETCFYRKHASAMSAQGAKMAESMARIYGLHADWEAIDATIRRSTRASAMLSVVKLTWRDAPLKALHWAGRLLLVDPAALPAALLSRATSGRKPLGGLKG